MMIQQAENTLSLYKNPFDDYNANELEPDLIMDYWCSPFTHGSLKEFDENRFFTDGTPIILQGSRGTGKTTILKYFSFPVQLARAKKNNKTILNQILQDGGVGYYFRCEDSFLEEFRNVFSLTVRDNWLRCFEYYFELLFTKNIIEIIKTIIKEEKQLNFEKIDKRIESIWNQDIEIDIKYTNLTAFEKTINSQIKYINNYKNLAPFTSDPFNPCYICRLYDISARLIKAFSCSVREFSGIKFLILIDEYENLPEELQKMFNTKIKFCRSDIPLRIGMRSENVVTTATINDVEFLREDHDYRRIRLDQEQNTNELSEYLKGIATKRLELFKGISISNNIETILGAKEDYNAECQKIVDDKNSHLEYLLKKNPRIASDRALLKYIIKNIAYPENRIAEMLNALWVARCNEKQDLVYYTGLTKEAMLAFFQKNQAHPYYKKYKNDYQNKYRYALTVLICKAYKKNKSYYSFNTLCYLSEGNPRTFINMVRAIISDAMFYEKEHFNKTGKVSMEIQSQTVRNYAEREFNTTFAIIEEGRAIRNLILGLGNTFSEYHSDRYVRYPETNQFSFMQTELSEDTKKIINTAESWSLIKKKGESQRLSASVSQKGDLYRINRIFSPIFNISYRTRGGFNVLFSAQELKDISNGKYRPGKLEKQRQLRMARKKEKASTFDQLSLFDSEQEE